MMRITQMTHEELDTPLHFMSDYALMALKHELLRKVSELSNELQMREIAAQEQESVS